MKKQLSRSRRAKLPPECVIEGIVSRYNDKANEKEETSSSKLISCTICLEEIEKTKIARIENCEHQFCYDCIKAWATQSCNSCPNCKLKFNKIIIKNVFDVDQIIRIDDKELPLDDEEGEFSCHHCHNLIRPNE